MNKVYFGAFFYFFSIYQKKNYTISEIGALLKSVQEEVEKNPKKYVNDFKIKIAKYYKEQDKSHRE